MFVDAAFLSQGVLLRGRLYGSGSATELRPAVVMAPGFSATIEMTVDKYAEALDKAGFIVLLYDHAALGVSDGEPRQVINPWVQARGYRDALTYLLAVPGVDPERVALSGFSLSAAEVIMVAAVDERVAAVLAQVPICGPRMPPEDPDGDLFRALRDSLLDGEVTSLPATSAGPLPVVSSDQLGTPSLLKPISAFRWFIEYGGRHGTGWQNVATHVVPDTLAPFQPGLCSPYLRVPSFWLIAPQDEMPAGNPAVARHAYNQAGGDKELVEVGGGHFGLLQWPDGFFDLASKAQCDFLKRVLMP